ncbi:MAG TPA: hypothetical protein VD788_13740 [Candidatus Polarisedimenticolaceae bacterium]|nr:hypothetical protein [Candidatus Polarisedimenticolaceae bacterium]
MSLLDNLDPETLSPSRLWGEMDPASRRLAVETVYGDAVDDETARAEVDAAIAAAMRFRTATVRKLPQHKRVDYALRALRPDDTLASTLLLVLHLGRRREILEAFLDHLGIAHERGTIREHALEPPSVERLAAAVDDLYARFAGDQVDLYLAALLAMEPDAWAGLIPALESRKRGA